MKKYLLFAVAVTFGLSTTQLLAQDLLTELGVQPGTPQARMVEKLKSELDLNKDGMLDEAEKEELKKRFKARQQATIETQDKDKDGKISEEEKALFASRIQKFRENILKMHDADGDGRLNEQEKQKAQEWLASHKQLPLP